MKIKSIVAEIWKTTFSNQALLILMSITACLVFLSINFTAGISHQAYSEAILKAETPAGRKITFRSLEFSANKQHNLITSLSNLSDVETAVIYGKTIDMRFAHTGVDGEYYSVKPYKTADNILEITQGRNIQKPNEVIIGSELAKKLRLKIPQKYLETSDGYFRYAIVGFYKAKSPFTELDALALKGLHDEPVKSLSIVAANTAKIPWLITEIPSWQSNETNIKIETSPYYTALNEQSLKNLRYYTEVAVISAAVAGLILTFIISLVSTMLNRGDYGRRRALGASAQFLVILVLGQIGLSSLIGLLAGVGIILGYYAYSGLVPEFTYIFSVLVSCLSIQVVASLIPAVYVTMQDPVKVLRTP